MLLFDIIPEILIFGLNFVENFIYNFKRRKLLLFFSYGFLQSSIIFIIKWIFIFSKSCFELISNSY